MGFAQFLGQLPAVDSTNNAVNAGSAQTVTAGTYYLYSATAADSFLTALATALTASKGSAATASLNSDGTVTLGFTSSTSLTLSSSIADWLGFASATMSGASTYTGTKNCRYCWFPQRLAARGTSPASSQGHKVAKIAQVESTDGTVRTQHVATHVRNQLEFAYLTQSRTWNSSSDYSSLEEFWGDTLKVGRQFLYIPDSDTPSVAHAMKANFIAAQETTFLPTRTLATADLYWSYTINCIGIT